MNPIAKCFGWGIGLMAVCCLAGCDSGTKWKKGKYEVYWIDVPSDLTLGISAGEASIGRVMPQVFAVGENKEWMVAARYPDGDRTREEYFYFSKSLDDPYKNAEDIVRGPFSKAEFAKLKGELGLPDWSKRF